MSLLGHPLHELTAIQAKEFLDGAEAEPLLWEAKGTELDKHEVRRQICAFANGYETGYLILGASNSDGEWMLAPMNFNGDPPAWVSAVIGDVLRPVPRVDVATIRLQGGQIAVVEIPPIAVAPCICNGTVFERVSGRTIAVKDPARLAELYKRGHNARAGAQVAAAAATDEVIRDPDLEGAGTEWPRFALALSATGHAPDISSRLFTERFEQAMVKATEERLAPPLGNAPPPLQPIHQIGFEQSNRRLDCTDPRGHGSPCHWHVRAVWNGTVIVYAAWATNLIYGEEFMELIGSAWSGAADLLAALGGYGPAHMELRIDGGDALKGPDGGVMPVFGIGRGPVDSRPAEATLESVERELRRSTGERVYEPDPDESG